MRLADGVLVRWWGELARLVDAAGTLPRDVDVFVAEIPPFRRRSPMDAPTWSSSRRPARADELAAVRDRARRSRTAGDDRRARRSTIAGRVRFEPPERAAEALGRARVIVDASSGNDPARRWRSATLGRPLVVSSTSGAAEMLRGAQSYDLWHRRSILAAVANALYRAPPELRAGHYERSAAPARPAGVRRHAHRWFRWSSRRTTGRRCSARR